MVGDAHERGGRPIACLTACVPEIHVSRLKVVVRDRPAYETGTHLTVVVDGVHVERGTWDELVTQTAYIRVTGLERAAHLDLEHQQVAGTERVASADVVPALVIRKPSVVV